MKKTAAAVAIALSLVATSAAADVKIGYFNPDRLLRESAPALRAQKKLEKEFAGRLAEIQRMTKQAKDLQTALDRETNENERRNKERDLAVINRDLQRSQREYKEDFNLRRNEELLAMQERANRVINAIAENEKYDLILQDAVHVSARIDITDKVIKALATEK